MDEFSFENDKNKNLLNLSELALTDSDIIHLCEYLNNNHQITALNLNKNDISDEGAIALSCYLKKNKRIKKLLIANNDIDIYGLAALAELDTLTYLDVDGNKGIEPKLEYSQTWFLTFMQLFNLPANEGHCSGVSKHLVPKLIQKNSLSEIIYFNIAMKQMFEIYKAIGESILLEFYKKNEIVTFENYECSLYENFKRHNEDKRTFIFNVFYSSIFIPRFKIALDDWFKKLPKAKDKQAVTNSKRNKNLVEASLGPILENIHKNQNQNNLVFYQTNKHISILLEDIYTEFEFSKMLANIRAQAISNNLFFTIEISACNHSSLISFHPVLNKWTYTDANQLPIRFLQDENNLANLVFKAHTFDDVKPTSLTLIACVAKENKKTGIKIFNQLKHKSEEIPKEESFIQKKLGPILLGGSLLCCSLTVVIILSLCTGGLLFPFLSAPSLSYFLLGTGLAQTCAFLLGATATGIFLKIKECVTNDTNSSFRNAEKQSPTQQKILEKVHQKGQFSQENQMEISTVNSENKSKSDIQNKVNKKTAHFSQKNSLINLSLFKSENKQRIEESLSLNEKRLCMPSSL